MVRRDSREGFDRVEDVEGEIADGREERKKKDGIRRKDDGDATLTLNRVGKTCVNQLKMENLAR